MMSSSHQSLSLTMCQHCKSSNGLKKCSCGKVAYCKKSCQQEDWSRHKQDCPMVVVKGVENKGTGLVAIRNIPAGKIVLKEFPLFAFITDNTSPLVPLTAFNTFKKTNTEEVNDYMELFAPERVLADNDCPDLDYVKFCNIFAANAIAVGKIFHNGCKKEKLTGVNKLFSRINHSCKPTTVVDWEIDSSMIEVRALRNIGKGEELTGNYLGELAGVRKERMKVLERNWFFQCQCEVCSLVGWERRINNNTRKFILTQLDQLDPDQADKNNLADMLRDYLEVVAACYTIETEAMVELSLIHI